MFILQTTTAVLVAFLGLMAWCEIRNRLAKGRSRKKDLESPASCKTMKTKDSESSGSREYKPLLSSRSDKHHFDGDLTRIKDLYHKLHNLEHHTDVLPLCRQILLRLLSSTLNIALAEPNSGILTVKTFSRNALNDFLRAKDIDCTNGWEKYLNRRQTGGGREIFGERQEAVWWLKQSAPVKYVDGAWLGHINSINIPFCYRNITKNSWQVLSEELGDGDLAKNHVFVYQQLMKDIDAGLPGAHSEDFVHPRHGLTEHRCWLAAIAQLTICLFPHDFLPEVLGFNMAYESLPLHLLKTIKELRELRLNPYYFELHVSIDNADSGHAAMAAAAVADYVEMIEQSEGRDAADLAWRRIQAGYILAEGLPTTPESPSLKHKSEDLKQSDDTETALLRIFVAKSFVAHKVHCNSRLKIGPRSLVDWLDPEAMKDPIWQKSFLHHLSNSKPWVIKGDSNRSRLVKELSWEGKMFGSFTEKEVEIVKGWIDSLDKWPGIQVQDGQVYYDFIRRQPDLRWKADSADRDPLKQHPILTPTLSVPKSLVLLETEIPVTDLIRRRANVHNLIPLWFSSSALLEKLPSVPTQAADVFGSAVVRVLRAQMGFDVEGPGVAGMDEVHRTVNGDSAGIIELGLEMCRVAGFMEPKALGDALLFGDAKSADTCRWMLQMSLRWLAYRDTLVGMSWGFMELHEQVARLGGEDALIGVSGRDRLEIIAQRERIGLGTCRDEISRDSRRSENFHHGLAMAKAAIASCFT